jgi:hypothetical protein
MLSAIKFISIAATRFKRQLLDTESVVRHVGTKNTPYKTNGNQ